MGNFILGYSALKDDKFVDYVVTASSENADYPATNLKLYSSPKRHTRTLVQTECNYVFDFGSAKAIVAIILVDVNFTGCYIEGNATNEWGSPTFRYPAGSGNLTISKDERTQRYSVYIPLIGFNYEFARLVIPTQTPVDGLNVFRMGSLICLDTKQEFTQNPTYPYDYSADEKNKEIEFESGGYEDYRLGDFYWQGTFGFDVHERTYESEIWVLNSLGKDGLLVFYENIGDTSKVYVCKRRTEIQVSWEQPNINKIDTMTFRECI